MEQEILNDVSVNIIKWYTFRNESQILYIGENKSIINYLKEIISQNTICVNNIDKTECYKLNQKFDYIIVDILDLDNEKIKKIETMINNDGVMLLILENKYGISKFLAYDYKNQISEIEKVNNYPNISNIMKWLEENKCFINKYLVFPNKEKTDMIINEKMKITSDKIDKYFCKYNSDAVILANELNVMKDILKYDRELFIKIANTYILEVSHCKIKNDIKYVSFNNYRKNKYRLITKIRENIVEKDEENAEAKVHINEIAKNLEQLNKYNFEILDKYENTTLYSELVKDRNTLDIEFSEKSNDLEYITDILLKIKQELLNCSQKYSKVKNKMQDIIIENMNKKDMENLNFLEYAFYDMVPKNCFYIDNKFYFFDQEWMEKYLPVEFIIYRSIINCYDLVKKMDINILFEKMGISKYIESFEKIDKAIREKIIDIDRLNIYNQEYKKMYDIIYENKVLNQKKNNLEDIINEYKENDVKQDEYIKKLEVENLKLKSKKIRGFKF